MCRDPGCTNANGDDYCVDFGRDDYCHFDMHRKSHPVDLGTLLNAGCEQACDPHCYGSAPLILQRGGNQRLGKAGEFCTHHIECEGNLLCDYTQNTVKIGGYTMGVCRKADCTEKYGMGPWYPCDRERADPQICGPNFNFRWESCRATCDPMCYGAQINTEFRDALDKNGNGVDTSLVAMHTEVQQSASVVLQAFALFGFVVTAYGAGKYYMTK